MCPQGLTCDQAYEDRLTMMRLRLAVGGPTGRGGGSARWAGSSGSVYRTFSVSSGGSRRGRRQGRRRWGTGRPDRRHRGNRARGRRGPAGPRPRGFGLLGSAAARGRLDAGRRRPGCGPIGEPGPRLDQVEGVAALQELGHDRAPIIDSGPSAWP
jgi:hypothetical protein